MNVFQMTKTEYKSEIELYEIYVDFSLNRNNSNLIYIDYFKVYKVDDSYYKLVDCTKILKCVRDVSFIKYIFEKENKVMKGKEHIFSTINELEQYILSLSYLNVNHDTYDKHKDLEFIFDVKNCKDRIINYLYNQIKITYIIEYDFVDFFINFTDEINDLFQEIAFIEKVKSENNSITYRYKNKEYSRDYLF